MKPRTIDEHRTKSPLHHMLNGLARRLGFAYYDMYYSQSMLENSGHPTGDSTKVTVEPAEKIDLEIVAARLPEISRFWFERSIEEGSSCYLGHHEGQVIGYVFANYRAVFMLGDELASLPEGFLYLYNTYVFPEFRGKGLYTIFLKEFRANELARGNRYLSSLVERANLPSLGAGNHFAARRERAPILYLPGLKPIVLGKGFRMMGEVEGAS